MHQHLSFEKKDAVLLLSHGTISDLSELPPFLTRIRRNKPPSQALLAEVTRRYQAIGGSSPLNDINLAIAGGLEMELKTRVACANRLCSPYPEDILRDFARAQIERVLLFPLAQFSCPIYVQNAHNAFAKMKSEHVENCENMSLYSIDNWALEPELISAYELRIRMALAELTPAQKASVSLIFTAHSLPITAPRAGQRPSHDDPYESLFRQTCAILTSRLKDQVTHMFVAFQSQGLSEPREGTSMEWLGPDLAFSFDEAKKNGNKHVLIAPIGFLCDHVEILYDLDIEARGMAQEMGLSFSRMKLPNSDSDFIQMLALLAKKKWEERLRSAGAP